MAFEWESFLRQRGIPHTKGGGNAARNELAVRCPMCGSQDEGMHMAISLLGRGWKCRRKPLEHKGRNPTRLVQALLQCSWEAAAGITKQGIFLTGNFAGEMALLKARFMAPKPRKPIKLLPEFLPFGTNKPSAQAFTQYLKNRNYTIKQIDKLTMDFGVRYCPRGSYKGRIVFPVYYNDKLVSWTGRTISKNVIPRYRALSNNEDNQERGLPIGVGPITNYLLWYDQLKKGYHQTLVLVEGPFDALRIMVLGQKLGIGATCLFTSQPSKGQVDLLHDLIPRVKRTFLLLDKGTEANAIRASSLISCDLEIITLQDFKDPGEIPTSRDLIRILRS